ncbi:hypothetical protein [Sphingobium sp.]|uniref:hypothetical protein n=1 Tax=Sphingobium sp. TaxID=1912891 RepID=UPI0035C74D51
MSIMIHMPRRPKQMAGISLARIAPGCGTQAGAQYVPPESLARVKVYRNPSAKPIEGGIGGVGNLRTRKPFDFDASGAAHLLIRAGVV